MEDLTLARKKTAMTAMRRGYLELELVLEPFARAERDIWTQADLDELAVLLAMEDLDLWEVVTGRQPAPAGVSPELLDRIRAHYPGRQRPNRPDQT